MRKRRQRQRRRLYFKKYSVAELAKVHSIPGLAAVVCRSESKILCKSGNIYYGDASLPMKGRTQYNIRAAPFFHGSPWFDLLRYRRPDVPFGSVRPPKWLRLGPAAGSGWSHGERKRLWLDRGAC